MAEDRVKHIVVMFCYCLVISFFFPLWIVVISGMVISIGKELYDKYIKKTIFDYIDLMFDLIGIVLGSLFSMVLRIPLEALVRFSA